MVTFRCVLGEMKKVKYHYGDKLTKQDVLDALVRGDETITALLMTCVAYDHEFANYFADFSDYEHRVARVKGSQTTKEKSVRRRSPSLDSDSHSVNSSFKTDGEGVRCNRPQRKRIVPKRFVVDIDDSMGSDAY